MKAHELVAALMNVPCGTEVRVWTVGTEKKDNVEYVIESLEDDSGGDPTCRVFDIMVSEKVEP